MHAVGASFGFSMYLNFQNLDGNTYT